jgi:NhaP-type Na+/H+ and K+/H+ antiporter
MVDLMVAKSVSASAPLIGVAQNFGVGLGAGTLAGLLLVLFVRVIARSESAYVLLLAVMFVLYGVTSLLGGSPALAVLTAAVVLGNAEWILPRLGFQTGDQRLELSGASMRLSAFTLFIVKSIFFTFIGASLSAAPGPLVVGAGLAVVLLLVRWPVVQLVFRGAGLSPAQRAVAWVAMPRGLAAGVMAVAPLGAGIAGAELLPEPVFAAIVTSILLFAVGFAALRRRPA